MVLLYSLVSRYLFSQVFGAYSGCNSGCKNWTWPVKIFTSYINVTFASPLQSCAMVHVGTNKLSRQVPSVEHKHWELQMHQSSFAFNTWSKHLLILLALCCGRDLTSDFKESEKISNTSGQDSITDCNFFHDLDIWDFLL